MTSRQSRLLFLLFFFECFCVGGGKHSVVWEGQGAVLQCAEKVDDTFDRTWQKYEMGNWKTAVVWFPGAVDFIVPSNSPLNAEHVTMIEDGSLEIANASYPESSGIFKYTNGHIECVVTLSVYQKMKSLTLHGFGNMIPENSDVSFTCMVDGGYPEPVIAWETPDKVLMSRVNSSTHQSIITFPVTKDQNYQELKCRASIHGEYLVESYRFNISYKPRVNIATLSGRTLYIEGEEDTLLCSAEGNPLPIITWKQGGTLVSHEITANQSLIDTDDDGQVVYSSVTVKFQLRPAVFSCTATNSEGSVQVFLSPTVFGVTLAAVAGSGAVAGLVLLIPGLYLCYRQCKSKLLGLWKSTTQQSSDCEENPEHGIDVTESQGAFHSQTGSQSDADVDSLGYQTHSAVMKFFESDKRRRSLPAVPNASPYSSNEGAVGGRYPDEGSGMSVQEVWHDSAEYLHAKSKIEHGAIANDVQYIPMDGSVKAKTRWKEKGRQKQPRALTVQFNKMSFQDTYRALWGELDNSESLNSIEYTNLPVNRPQPIGCAHIDKGGAGKDLGARPKQFEVIADVHYTSMGGSENAKTKRKDKGRCSFTVIEFDQEENLNSAVSNIQPRGASQPISDGSTRKSNTI